MATDTSKVHHPLYTDLAAIVGRDYVSDDEYVGWTYSRDTSPARGYVQGIVVRPDTTEQVVQIVKLANLTKTPIVPSGGRASFFGAPPGQPGKGIVVDMTRMNRLINIDEENLTVTAEAGMTTAELTCAVAEKGWDIHTAYQPWYPDTLGGQISGFCGAGGGYELSSSSWTAIHIAGVKVVLPDGSVLQTGAGAGNNIMNQGIMYDRYPGNPDITGMFMGDSGVFGIKVEASYRMYRLNKYRAARAYYWDTWEEGWEYCKELSTVETLPYTILPLNDPTEFFKMQGIEKYIVFPVAKGRTQNELDLRLETIDEMAAAHKGETAKGPGIEQWLDDAITGRRHREMGLFASPGVWNYLEFFTSRSQVVDCHRTVPDYIYSRLEKNNVPYLSNVGVVAEGSPSWITTTITWIPGHDKKGMQVMQDIFYGCTEMAASRGWYPDCHQGYGTQMMAKYWPKSHYDFMHRLKKELDPNNIMNPGLWDL